MCHSFYQNWNWLEIPYLIYLSWKSNTKNHEHSNWEPGKLEKWFDKRKLENKSMYEICLYMYDILKKNKSHWTRQITWFSYHIHFNEQPFRFYTIHATQHRHQIHSAYYFIRAYYSYTHIKPTLPSSRTLAQHSLHYQLPFPNFLSFLTLPDILFKLYPITSAWLNQTNMWVVYK